MNIVISDPYAAEKLKAQEVLYNVIDPELFVNVVDLGLIYDLDFEKENIITVSMTLSTPHCPMGEAITTGVSNVLQALFPEKTIMINLTFEPPWSFEMLTLEGRRLLGM